MESRADVVLPFKSLQEFYSNLSKLIPWPNVTPLRRLENYVHKGSEIDIQVQKPEKIPRNSVPKTIVCHDLKGNYLEDRFIHGSNVHDSYHFYNWAVIDIFVYFSHHFITIPPFGWTNAAHAHGVQILGTIITEGPTGRVIWEEVLKSIESTIKLADSLIYLTRFYKFDGWLLNVENELDSIDVPKLTFFVQYFTERLHNEVPNSKVIWYDSVIHDGKLIWQNELNAKNESFFNNCDGIFLNYNWTDDGLKKTVARANGRVHDVYVGLDVWGRGCPGGGGFNSAYALEKIRQNGLSVAIFAQAWTFEFFEGRIFSKIEDIFWSQLLPFLYIHVPKYENERFITTFCRGVGRKYYEHGMEITFQDPAMREMVSRNNSFYNLTLQKHQALMPSKHMKFTSVRSFVKKAEDGKKDKLEFVYDTEHFTMKVLGSRVTLSKKSEAAINSNLSEFFYDTSYEGGGCLKLVNNDVKSYHRLFFVSVAFSEDIQARVIFKNTNENPVKEVLRNDPILLLIKDDKMTSFTAKETVNYGMRWKMSIFQTNVKSVNEIGLAFPESGSFYIGKLVLEKVRYPHRMGQNFYSDDLNK